MDDIFKKIDARTQKYRVSHWAGTFREYLPLVLAQPKLARLAHARIYDMVRSYGVDSDDQGNERYHFFGRELFGIDDALAKVVEYLKAAALVKKEGLGGNPELGNAAFQVGR